MSIDTIFEILSSTLFNPLWCWYPFIFRSILQLGYQFVDPQAFVDTYDPNDPYSSEPDSITLFIKTYLEWSNYWTIYLVFAAIITISWDVVIFDRWIRLRGSRQRHTVSNEKDAIVITGAGSINGIGRHLARWFRRRGYYVIALDVIWEENKGSAEENDVPIKDGIEMHPIQFIRCDVADYDQVSKLYNGSSDNDTIFQLIPNTHFPSVLVNAAGVTHNKTLIDLDPAVIKTTIDVNLLGPFWTCKSLLTEIARRLNIEVNDQKNTIRDEKETDTGSSMVPEIGATIVNVSSIIGTIGPSQLTAYSASKAGLKLFHDSLTHELGEPYYSKKPSKSDLASSEYKAKYGPLHRRFPVNTLLVLPGQVSTRMFQGVDTPSNFFGPILLPEQVASEIGIAILTSRTGTLELPLYTRFAWVIWVLPGFLVEGVRKLSGVDEKMSTWKGLKQD